MKFKTVASAAAVVAATLLFAGCSAPEPAPTPTSTTRGTIKMPDAPVVTATPTPTTTPDATPTPGASPLETFPREGVDPQGVERDATAEALFLSQAGLGGEPILDDQGQTYASVIEKLEGVAPTGDYLLNVLYVGCAEAQADTTATPIDQMAQRIINETAEALNYAVADEVVERGYAPIIKMGLATLCGPQFSSLTP